MPRRKNISMEDILFGVGHGRPQSVGNMEVIPLVDEGGIQDEGIDPPAVEVSTPDYGTVNIRHSGSNPTILPTGAGWVVKEAAQDHAVGSGSLVSSGESKNINTAMCIESTQGGTIKRGAHDMLILPVGLRSSALALRKERGYSKLWDSIGSFNSGYGIAGRKELVYFLKNFKKQLDQFVAEFELVSKQIGAIIMVNGKLVGVEVAPNVEYWSSIWDALIRVCYGSFAIRHANPAYPNREPLRIEMNTLDGIRSALESSWRVQMDKTSRLLDKVRGDRLVLGTVDERMGSYQMMTVGSPGSTQLAGQMVVSESSKTAPYLSVCVKV